MAKKIKKSIAKAVVKAASRSKIGREELIKRLRKRLNQSYDNFVKDEEARKFQKAFGLSLIPFFERVMEENSKLVGKLIDFGFQWAEDMEKREGYRKEGLMAPDTYVLEPTNRCNLNCYGCYAASRKKGEDLPYSVMEQIDEEMRKAGVTLTTLSGGEPFLREKQDKSITRLAENTIKKGNKGGFLVYTNGTLINEEIAKRLGELGNIWPAISIEGFEESTKKRRGKGIIEQIKKAKELLRKYNVMYGFSATATRENAEEIASERFFQERLEEGDYFGWVFIYQPIGRNANADLMVSGEQRYKVGAKIMEMQLQRKVPLFLGDFWNYGPFVEGCIAGGRCYFHIMADGTISPCVFSPFGSAHLKEIETFSQFYPNGEKKYKNLQDAITRNEVFVAYRKAQDKIKDRFRPCVLIDHPSYARNIFNSPSCFPTNNTPPSYFSGKIAGVIDDRAREWKEKWAPKLKEYAVNLVDKVLAS